MKVINDLVVVEVPKGAKQFEYFDKETLPTAIVVHLESDENGMPNLHPIQLPFPCTIIGLASEIDDAGIYTVLTQSGAIVWEKKDERDFMLRWLHKMHQIELHTDTQTLLFLKKVQQ